jgi:hypothetical protein
MIENLSHIQLNIKLPIACKNELLEIKDYYGLPIKKYYRTSLGHAFRSYVSSQKAAYNINNIKTFKRTNSWNKIPKTIKWITENLCDEKDLGMVCLHKLTANGWVDWHRHNHNFEVVHFSLVTNNNDLSEVKINDEIYSVNYPELEGYIFNSREQHRSTNFSDHDRIHLVVECLPNNGKFKALYNKRN